jgi:hypothetical protein
MTMSSDQIPDVHCVSVTPLLPVESLDDASIPNLIDYLVAKEILGRRSAIARPIVRAPKPLDAHLTATVHS